MSSDTRFEETLSATHAVTIVIICHLRVLRLFESEVEARNHCCTQSASKDRCENSKCDLLHELRKREGKKVVISDLQEP